MVLRFFLFASIFLFLSCTSVERDNPYDPDGVNYIGYAYCLYYGSCSYMSVSNCNGTPYGSDNTCGGYVYVSPSSSSRPGSSSSSRPGSSSSSRQSGVIHGASVTYGNETYETVVIGTQTWMARNLNYNASGSKCGNVLTGTGALVDANTATCDTYGRLYDWATAMNIAASCNTSTIADCGATVSSPNHQGVCPAGWHLPSDAEWTTLTDFVGSSTAGTKLKATEGWSSGNGTDDYGFSALPGGLGYSGGYFYGVGDSGYWWSASESSSYRAYGRYMLYDYEYASYINYDKSFLFSVRCLQD